MALEGKSLHFLPPWPSGSPPLPVRQGAGRARTLLRLQRRVGRGREELESTPKGADSQRVSGRARLPCVEGQHGWHVEIKIKQHASTLNYSYK